MNKVKVAWNRPICQGGARVREYKVGEIGRSGRGQDGFKREKQINLVCHGRASGFELTVCNAQFSHRLDLNSKSCTSFFQTMCKFYFATVTNKV